MRLLLQETENNPVCLRAFKHNHSHRPMLLFFFHQHTFRGIFHKSQLCSRMPTTPPARHTPALLHPLSGDRRAHKAQRQPEGMVHKSSSGTRAVDDSGLQRKTCAAAFPSSWHHELPFKTEHKDCVAAKAAASN